MRLRPFTHARVPQHFSQRQHLGVTALPLSGWKPTLNSKPGTPWALLSLPWANQLEAGSYTGLRHLRVWGLRVAAAEEAAQRAWRRDLGVARVEDHAHVLGDDRRLDAVVQLKAQRRGLPLNADRAPVAGLCALQSRRVGPGGGGGRGQLDQLLQRQLGRSCAQEEVAVLEAALFSPNLKKKTFF